LVLREGKTEAMATNQVFSTGCPVDPARTESLPRRSALRLLVGSVLASLASVFYPVARYLIPPPEAASGAAEALAGLISDLPPNSGKTFRFGSRPALLVRLSSGEYRSMSAVCTHLGCTVQYRAENQQVWCACHNGCYDLNGKNVSGPPPRGLEAYDVHVRGQEIYVTKKA
jgi:cytochrome b6-f complex iron-sulfur subunit